MNVMSLTNILAKFVEDQLISTMIIILAIIIIILSFLLLNNLLLFWLLLLFKILYEIQHTKKINNQLCSDRVLNLFILNRA